MQHSVDHFSQTGAPMKVFETDNPKLNQSKYIVIDNHLYVLSNSGADFIVLLFSVRVGLSLFGICFSLADTHPLLEVREGTCAV